LRIRPVSGLAKIAGCIAFSWPIAIMAYDTASLPTVAGAAPDWLKFAGGKLALNWLPVSPSHLLWHLLLGQLSRLIPWVKTNHDRSQSTPTS